jgi:ATP phosphoribosyltransferase regulatory subunit
LAAANDDVKQALDELEQITQWLLKDNAELALHIDLAELRGYHYHTGIVFAAYQSGMGKAIAQGGRYDDIGAVFGRARPATGFSANLRTLLQLDQTQTFASTAIFAPAENDQALNEKIDELRNSGHRVIRGMPGQVGDASVMGCKQQLVLKAKQWVIEEINSN